MSLFSDKIVLITGTGGGIGCEAALQFAREGATVYGCDISQAQHQASRDFLSQHGFELKGYGGVDLGDPSQSKEWIDHVVQAEGRIDVLFNNASAAKFGGMENYSIEDWYFTVRNELDLVFFTTHFAWPHLPKGSVILNMGSTAAWCGSTSTGKVAHTATKGGVVAMARELAADGASKGIRAVSISPGFIKTPGTAAFIENPDVKKQLLSGVLLNRPGETSDVINLALFLASDKASFITGSDHLVDGGMLAT